ncbi:MAG: LysR family transcriptional regulator [Planctomycetota bacterium]|jgi:DNA-binding transcriptional LysR family regulator
MDMDLLRSLSEVARRGAITEAARALHLTQPALSRRIQLLEEEFGAELLSRSRKGVRLTELGRLVEAEGRQLVERFERLQRDVGAHLRLEQGTVRIGGGATAVSFLLPGLIREFRQEHREIVFQVKEAGSREIEAAVLREELELGIVTLPAQARELDVTPVLDDPIVLAAARDHPLVRRKRVHTSDLDGMPLIGFEAGSAIRRLIDDALQDAGVRVDVVMELRAIQSMLRMVALKLGLAFVSRLGLEAAGRGVKEVAVRDLRIRRPLGVIRLADRPLSVASEAFLQSIIRRT